MLRKQKRRKSMSFFDECVGNLEQQNAYRMIANTNNSFFLTGKAGTGKSTFLRRICEEVKKRFVVLAPTGPSYMIYENGAFEIKHLDSGEVIIKLVK